MDAATVVLLVTWIKPGGADQPNVINSYQSTFASVEACEAAGDKILQDAQRINSQGRAQWDAYGRRVGAARGHGERVIDSPDVLSGARAFARQGMSASTGRPMAANRPCIGQEGCNVLSLTFDCYCTVTLVGYGSVR